MKKNPFKMKSAIDTAVNVAIGGASSVAVDYAIRQIDALSGVSATYMNLGKLALGAVVGSMATGKVLPAMANGIATVAVANLVNDNLLDSTPAQTAGLRPGTIGRVRMGNRQFRHARVAGVSTQGFMGK